MEQETWNKVKSQQRIIGEIPRSFVPHSRRRFGVFHSGKIDRLNRADLQALMLRVWSGWSLRKWLGLAWSSQNKAQPSVLIFYRVPYELEQKQPLLMRKNWDLTGYLTKKVKKKNIIYTKLRYVILISSVFKFLLECQCISFVEISTDQNCTVCFLWEPHP